MAFAATTLTRTLATNVLGNSLADWLRALAVTLLLLLFAALMKRLLRRRFQHRAAAAAAGAAPGPAAVAAAGGGWLLALDLMRHTRWLLMAPAAVYLGTLSLEQIPHQIGTALRDLAVLAVLLQVALWATVAVDLWVSRERRRRLASDAASATVLGAFSIILRLLVWTVLLLLGLDNLGVNITTLVAGLGVGGIAVALALQNILADILASLSIAIDKPFLLGDTIQVDTFVGTVEDVGLKTTRLRSLSGEQLIFANADLLKSRIRNLKRMTDRRVLLAFGVDYRTAADQLERLPALLRALVEAQPGARFGRAHFKGIGQASLDFELVFYLADPDDTVYLDTQQAVLLALIRTLEREQIKLAQPDRTLWVTAETEPPAPRSRATSAPAGA
jgi:small-conductance mechanosensitive channel